MLVYPCLAEQRQCCAMWCFRLPDLNVCSSCIGSQAERAQTISQQLFWLTGQLAKHRSTLFRALTELEIDRELVFSLARRSNDYTLVFEEDLLAPLRSPSQPCHLRVTGELRSDVEMKVAAALVELILIPRVCTHLARDGLLQVNKLNSFCFAPLPSTGTRLYRPGQSPFVGASPRPM